MGDEEISSQQLRSMRGEPVYFVALTLIFFSFIGLLQQMMSQTSAQPQTSSITTDKPHTSHSYTSPFDIFFLVVEEVFLRTAFVSELLACLTSSCFTSASFASAMYPSSRTYSYFHYSFLTESRVEKRVRTEKKHIKPDDQKVAKKFIKK